MTHTLSDALAADLRDCLAAAAPAGLDIRRDDIRLRHDTRELPGRRIVIRPGEARMETGMDGTGTCTVEIDFITPMDRTTPDAHRAMAAALAGWWSGLRAARRRQAISSRCLLHDLRPDLASPSIEDADREQVTTLRGDFIVTLFAL